MKKCCDNCKRIWREECFLEYETYVDYRHNDIEKFYKYWDTERDYCSKYIEKEE